MAQSLRKEESDDERKLRFLTTSADPPHTQTKMKVSNLLIQYIHSYSKAKKYKPDFAPNSCQLFPRATFGVLFGRTIFKRENSMLLSLRLTFPLPSVFWASPINLGINSLGGAKEDRRSPHQKSKYSTNV